jgi:hypothetical protein
MTNTNINSNNSHNLHNSNNHAHLRKREHKWAHNLHYSVYKSEHLVNIKPDFHERHIILLCKNRDQYFEVAFNELNYNQPNSLRLGVIENFDKIPVGKDIIDFIKYTFNENHQCYKIITEPDDGVDLRYFFDEGYLQEWLHEETTTMLDHKDLPKLFGYVYDGATNRYHLPYNSNIHTNIEMYFFGGSYIDEYGNIYPHKNNESVRWKDQNGNSMTNGKGLHEVHLNAYGDHQDGCVIIHDKIKNTWKLIGTVFVNHNKIDAID